VELIRLTQNRDLWRLLRTR